MGIKPIRFGTYGPFRLRVRNVEMDKSTLDKLWEQAGNLSCGIGVYIICSLHEGSYIPWYVGKTDGGFQKRFYQHLKQGDLYRRLDRLLSESELHVIFLSRHSETGRLKKARKAGSKTKTKANPTINRLEYDILRVAFAKNDQLMNKSMRVYVAKLEVPGFSGIARDEKSASAAALRETLK